MKDCLYYQEMISAMLDGELSAREQQEMEEHLIRCPDCRAMHAAFLSLSQSMGEDTLPLPQGLHEKIMTGVKTAQQKKKRTVIVKLRPYMAAAACLVLIMAAVLRTGNGNLPTMSAKEGAAMMVKSESSVVSKANYAPESGMKYAVAEETETCETAVEDAAIGIIYGADHDDAAKKEAPQESEAPPSPMPEPTPEVEPVPPPVAVSIDAVSCLLTTTVDDKVIAERLDGTDTKVWITTLVLSGDKYADMVDPALISYTMEITRKSGEKYTLYLHYGEGEQLLCSRRGDGSEAIEIREIRDLTVYADETEANK